MDTRLISLFSLLMSSLKVFILVVGLYQELHTFRVRVSKMHFSNAGRYVVDSSSNLFERFTIYGQIRSLLKVV